MMLLLTLLSPLVVVATSSWGPKHKRCPTLLAAATQFDLDNSGGLDRSEFFNFLSAIASGSSGTVSTLFKEKEEAAYNLLLCQCYHVFCLPMSCCDNTTTEKSSSMWKEVSLDSLATDEDSIKMGRKSYDKVFCEEMMRLMDETGMILATNLTSIDVSATTTTATTSTAATTHSLVESINTTEPTLSPDDAVTAATTSSAAAAAAVTTIPTTIPETTGLIVSSSSSSSESIAVDSLTSSSITDSKSIQGSGFAVGGIIALFLAMTLIAFIIAALIVANKRRSNNKRCVLKDDSNLSEDIENNYAINAKADVDVDNWHDNDDNNAGQGAGASSRSSLAAMGVASLVTTQWSVSGGGGMDTSNIDDDGSYIGSIVEEVDNCIDKPMGI